MSFKNTSPKQFRLYLYLLDLVENIATEECVLWPYAKTRAGYGVVTTPERKREYVHRIAYWVANGRWPEPNACHRCDVRACINPSHLFEGDDAANLKDMREKGRGYQLPPMKGERHALAKLTDGQVVAMRTEYSSGPHEMTRLAEKYGVSYYTVWDIINRRSRTDI